MKRAFILDTDIGTNPDDFFALLMLLNSQINLGLILTGNCYPIERAKLVKKIIRMFGKDFLVAAGEEKGNISFFAEKYLGEETLDIEENYCNLVKKICDENEEVIYIAIQGLSNLAVFLREFPEHAKKLTIYHMGATIKDADRGLIQGGTNMEADPLAAKFIYEAGLKLRVIGSHTTINDKIRINPESRIYKKLKESGNKAHSLLFAHLHDYYDRRKLWPAMHDPLAVSAALGEKFVNFEETGLIFDEFGRYQLGGGKTVFISAKKFNEEGFMKYLYQLLFEPK